MATAAITGTVGDGATEAEIVAGTGTIIITLTGDTWPAAGGGTAGPFTYVQSNAALASATTITLTGVGAGNTIIVFTKWEGVGAATDTSVADGATPFVAGTAIHTDTNSFHSQIHYLLSSAGGSRTFTITWPGNTDWAQAVVAEFSHSGAGAVVEDAEEGGTGSGTALQSNNTNTSVADTAVIGCGASFTGTQAFSSHQINDIAADGNVNATYYVDDDGVYQTSANCYSTMWWRILTGTMSGGHAQVTADQSDSWHCHVISFK